MNRAQVLRIVADWRRRGISAQVEDGRVVITPREKLTVEEAVLLEDAKNLAQLQAVLSSVRDVTRAQ